MSAETPLIDIRPDHWEIVQRILQEHVPNLEVWAFGSRAKWNAKAFSDLDLAIITDEPLPLDTSAALNEAFSESDLPWKVDVVDWASVGDELKKVITRDKVVLKNGDGLVEGKGWKECFLGDVVELKRGYDLPQKKRLRGNVPLISSSGITDFHSISMVKGPGVVTGRYGTLGQVFFVDEDFWPLNTTLYVHDFKGNDPRFVAYFLRSIDFLSYSDKAAVPGINRNHLHRAPIKIPTNLEEQRAIARILGTLDDKIELNRKQNETLEAMARAMFKAWFVDFEPVRAKMEGRWKRGQSLPGMPAHLYDLFPDRMVESELGEIPEGWSFSTIGKEVTLCGGSTPSTKETAFWENGKHCWATPKDLSGKRFPVLMDTDRKITDAGLAKISSGLLPVGTVLLSSRAPIGYLAIAEVPTAINQGFIAMKCNGVLSNVFVLMWCAENMEAIIGKSNGSTFQEISKSSFRSLPVVISPALILDGFLKTVEPFYRKIVVNERESTFLAKVRDTLLPKLISGGLRIQNVE